MENHHFSWENPLYMAIFNSYFDITRGYPHQLEPPMSYSTTSHYVLHQTDHKKKHLASGTQADCWRSMWPPKNKAGKSGIIPFHLWFLWLKTSNALSGNQTWQWENMGKSSINKYLKPPIIQIFSLVSSPLLESFQNSAFFTGERTEL